jgi:uncharacterized damage-inducible protein DinB
MTKNYFIQLADYNIWANNVVRSWYDQVTDEQYDRSVISSFSSLSATALHIASAETVWVERLKKVPSPAWLQSSFKGSKKELLDIWSTASQNIRSFIGDFDESMMQANLHFRRLNGDPYEMPYHELFAHIFNHSSYHRGQIVTMMRQVGFTDVSALDMLVFFRKYI